MKPIMDSALIMILMLSSISVMTKEQKETVESIPFPDAPLVFQRVEKVNDAEMFWETTDAPPNEPPVVLDGNHPDNDEITTHDHVDKAMGHIPPTKRVKKILPPFEGGRLRTARHIDDVHPRELRGPGGATSTHPQTQPVTAPPKTGWTQEESTTAESASSFEGAGDSPTPPKAEEEIRGIRLVPNEPGAVLGEGEGEEEGLNMQKSIWDLLRERERFNTDSTHLDGVESSGNETEVTTRLPIEKSKSPFEHFDSDSAEVEFETQNFNGGSNIEKHELPISYAMPWLQVKDREFDVRVGEEMNPESGDIPEDVSKLLQLTDNEKSVNGVSVSVIGSEGGEEMRYGRRASKWYLLLLTGNSTIVELRRKDFTKYLKLNLAARLSVEYDDVRVNKVVLAPPKVLVNISVFAPSDDVAEESQLDFKVGDKGEAPLYKLAETNATLLELSGEEYHVIRFLSFESQEPAAEAHKDVPTTVSMASRQTDLEFIIYTFLGSACACAALLAFFLTLSKYYKKVSDFACFKPNQTAWKVHEDSEQDKDDFSGVSPAVIYSGGFPQIRGSWMTGVGHQGAPFVRRQCPALELATSPPAQTAPQKPPDRPAPDPRHTKLHIYNCHADSLLIPMPLGSKALRRASDTHPLDLTASAESTGQDNPIFTN